MSNEISYNKLRAYIKTHIDNALRELEYHKKDIDTENLVKRALLCQKVPYSEGKRDILIQYIVN